MSAEEVLSKFSGRGFTHGEELFVAAEAGAELVEDCERRNLAVIGIDGFVRDADGVVAQPDLIADFSDADAASWEEFRTACNRDSLNFIRQLPQERKLFLNFVIISEQEW
ncbi:MAG TPA: hypothetical protein VGV59_07120 [Pyrinomonadaceae bacterium]|nr:hypothetical protein [Pyrinomonadaceae bacterium]